MIKKTVAALAAFTLALAGMLSSGAPVYAALTDCPAGYVCLFNGSNGTNGRWQANLNTLASGGCWNLANSTYTTGVTVNNTASSLTFDPTAAQKLNHWRIHFSDWVCGAAGAQQVSDDLDYNLGVPSLSNYWGTNWENRFTSVYITVSA
jgi:hypothetical protein